MMTNITIFRSCDKMRCTNCDFKVVIFDNCVWNPSLDVLFFRNYIFDDSKLKSALSKKPGVSVIGASGRV